MQSQVYPGRDWRSDNIAVPREVATFALKARDVMTAMISRPLDCCLHKLGGSCSHARLMVDVESLPTDVDPNTKLRKAFDSINHCSVCNNNGIKLDLLDSTNGPLTQIKD